MALADGVSFTAASAGTGTFVFASARNSFLTPAQAVSDGELVDGQTVSYLAQDSLSAPTQREWGHGTFSQSGNSVARTSVLGGTNGTSPVSFSVAPVVSLTALAEDLLCYTSTLPASNSATGTPFQFTFDGSGNLYICWAANSWAKYSNQAPFTNASGSQQHFVLIGF